MFRLDTPRRYRLTEAPLAQALVQVRFPIVAKLQSTEGITPVQERLRSRYPYMAQRQEIQVQPGVAGVAGGLVWELTDDDGRMVAVTTSSVALSVGPVYEGVEEFADRYQEVLAVMAEEAQVPRCDRLGARYLTVADLAPGDDSDWKGWFRSELTGWPATELLDDETVPETMLNQVILRSPAEGVFAGVVTDVRANVQHGLVPAGSVIPGTPPVTTDTDSYVLILDLYCETPQPFYSPTLRSEFEALHAEIDAFFHWSLTSEGKSHFGYEELP